MLHHPPTQSLPRIVISAAEEGRLTALATTAAAGGRAENVARVLLAEMERAEVVADNAVPKGVVRMESVVEFEIDGQNRRSVQVVYPGDANIDANKISVLTPIGAALIGLSAGQSIPMNGHDGRPHKLTVVSVSSHT